MQGVACFFLVMLVAFVAVASMTYQSSRSSDVITTWAEQNGLTVLSKERCLFNGGPFFFRTSRSQTVYLITVRDAQQQTRRAYVRCGGFFFGLSSDAIAVEWVD